jgi:ribulose-phosphate 3-epimerase
MKIQHIIPAIIPDSLEQLERKLREVKGIAHRVQIDVMNGTYAPGKSWPYDGAGREAFEAIRREDSGLPYWQDFDFEIDLLLKNPEERIDEWALAGAACLVAHVESTDKLAEFIATCADKRLEVGLALKPSTDIELLASHIQDAAFVQVMGNDHIGKNGVPLDERVFDKIKEIKWRWSDVVVGVDIGVNEETLPKLMEAGATRFASGSAIFESGDAVRMWKNLEAMATTSE